MVKTRDYGNEEEAGGDAWLFEIGWNRKVDPATGHAPGEPRDPRFRTNEIQSAKYTKCNFIPFNFFHQLSKGPNIYYLFICVLQMIKPISITSGSPTNLPPLLFLMIVSMVKDFYEDRRRRKSDKVENLRNTIVVGGATATGLNEAQVAWHAVRTG